MNPFVRFIFVIISVAAVLTLAIVMSANYVNQRNMQTLQAAQHDTMVRHYDRLLESPCQAYLAVEWQKTGRNGKVLESSLLIQPFTVDAGRRPIALPVQRLLINGDTVTVEGMTLEFKGTVPEDFAFLRNKKLFLFTDFHEKDTPANRSGFIIPGKVPDVARVNFGQTSDEERRLWHGLGEPLRAYFDHGMPTSRVDMIGVKITAASPESKTVANGALYKVFFDSYGMTVTENRDADVYSRIRDEAAKLP